MPRERMHWLVLEGAIELISREEAPEVKRCLLAEREVVMLGAMAHDAPFYYHRGRHPLAHLGELLHGTAGGDTLYPIVEAVQHIFPRPMNERDVLWAFVLGMLSHMATDIAFHPMVYYLTGNYYHPDARRREHARKEHRALETYLDTWARKREILSPALGQERERTRAKSLAAKDETLQGLLAGTAGKHGAIAKFLDEALIPAIIGEHRDLFEQRQTHSFAGEAFCSNDLAAQVVGNNHWWQAILSMAKFQRMFISRPWGVLAKVLSLLCPQRFAAIEALFRLGREDVPRFLLGEIAYRNPVTGNESSATLEQLLQTAVAETKRLFLLFEPIVSGRNKEPGVLLAAEKGMSLNFGLHDVGVEQGRWFSEGP